MAGRPPFWVGLLGVLALVAQGRATAPSPAAFPGRVSEGGSTFAMPPLPLESLAPKARAAVRRVLEKPTLSAAGPSDRFASDPERYFWLMDHPREAAALWRELGAKVTEIEARGPGHYGWRDPTGNELSWETVYRGPEMRIWYAEGRGRPGILFPYVGVQAVVVMKHEQIGRRHGRPLLQHQAFMTVRTDSRALALVARLMGASAPRLAEQYLGQLETYFGGLAWYLEQDEGRARRMFEQAKVAWPLPQGR